MSTFKRDLCLCLLGLAALMAAAAQDGLYLAAGITAALVTFSRYLEYRSGTRATDMAERLEALKPKTARVRRGGGGLEIPASEVVPGDILAVEPGERIPADGEIINGFAQADESMFTGEAEPVDKRQGDKALCGSVNMSGSFEMRAEKPDRDAALSRMILAARSSARIKSPTQRTADTALRIFVPAVIVISAVAFAAWYFMGFGFATALTRAASALVAACPGAIGLAASSKIAAGIGKAMGRGIFIKNGEALESMGKINAVLLSKAGVITQGQPVVTDITAFEGFFEEEVLSFAAAAEKNSAHPLGRAIYDYTRPAVLMGDVTENIVRATGGELVSLHNGSRGFVGASLPPAEEFEEFPGRGVKAFVGGRWVLVGTRIFLRENGIDISAHESGISLMEDEGKSVALVAVGKKAAGSIAFMDEITWDARESVSRLDAMGIEACMVTGDSEGAARAAAQQAGISNVIADVSPQSKADGAAKIKAAGRFVAVVGAAGDTPAPESAGVSIAVSRGGDIPAPLPDITLLRPGIGGLPEAISLCGSASRKAKRSLFAALACDAAVVLAAAAGLLSPVVAAMAAAIISVYAALDR